MSVINRRIGEIRGYVDSEIMYIERVSIVMLCVENVFKIMCLRIGCVLRGYRAHL